jgi:hypothetical protein
LSAVWICQCLCPDRHCILASAGEAETEAEAEKGLRMPLRQEVAELLRSGIFNPWCAICDANPATWRYELRRTLFATMKEALPKLLEAEGANMAANLVWGDLHKTSRPN